MPARSKRPNPEEVSDLLLLAGEKKCTLGVFIALAFMADFSSDAPEFYQRTHRVRLKNSGTSDKKSSHKIKYKKIPRVHEMDKEKWL